MERALITALCLLSCVLAVTGYFTSEAVGEVTDYVTESVVNPAWPRNSRAEQYAYAVKLTAEECRRDQASPNYVNTIPRAFYNVIKREGQINEKTITSDIIANRIYTGNRVILASYRKVYNNGVFQYTEHAEYRLLFPAEGQNVSPMQNFLNQEPVARCVVFFSHLAPCVNNCLRPNGAYNILANLRANFGNLQDKAFAFTKPYQVGNAVTLALANLNAIMPLFRCDGPHCQRCFANDVANNAINPYCSPPVTTRNRARQ